MEARDVILLTFLTHHQNRSRLCWWLRNLPSLNDNIPALNRTQCQNIEITYLTERRPGVLPSTQNLHQAINALSSGADVQRNHARGWSISLFPFYILLNNIFQCPPSCLGTWENVNVLGRCITGHLQPFTSLRKALRANDFCPSSRLPRIPWLCYMILRYSYFRDMSNIVSKTSTSLAVSAKRIRG